MRIVRCAAAAHLTILKFLIPVLQGHWIANQTTSFRTYIVQVIRLSVNCSMHVNVFYE